jgi:hypothetical protein
VSIIVGVFAVSFAYKNLVEAVKSLPMNWRDPLEDAVVRVGKKVYPVVKEIMIKIMK